MPKHPIEKSCRYHKFIRNSRNRKECAFLCNREFLGISCCIKKWTILISLGSPIFLYLFAFLFHLISARHMQQIDQK